MNDRTIDTLLIGAHRNGRTRNGNGRWRLYTASGTYTTQTSVIDNCTGVLGNLPAPVTLHATPSGRVGAITLRSEF